MAQLDPSRYKRLSKSHEYGVSDGLYWDTTNSEMVVVIDDTVKAKFPLSQTADRVMVSDGTDIEPSTVSGSAISIASQARGDILRRGASAWERHAAKTSGQILVGDGTDIVSVATSGDVTLAASGAMTIGTNKVLASMLGANLGKGHIPLDLFTARIISANAIQATTEGGVPDSNTSPSIARVNGATDKAGRLIWAAADVTEIQFAPIAYPGDLDDAAAVTVHLLAAMAGATDTPTIAVAFFEGVGDTNAGGNTGAVTGTTVTEYSASIAAGDIGAHPKAATVTLTPAAHGTDAIHLYAAWLEYTRKS